MRNFSLKMVSTTTKDFMDLVQEHLKTTVGQKRKCAVWALVGDEMKTSLKTYKNKKGIGLDTQIAFYMGKNKMMPMLIRLFLFYSMRAMKYLR